MNKIEQATKQIPEFNRIELIYSIVEEAYLRFCACEIDSDFCVQYSTGSCIIFGGHNRVIWTSIYGFNPQRSYCTEQFLKRWDEKYG